MQTNRTTLRLRVQSRLQVSHSLPFPPWLFCHTFLTRPPLSSTSDPMPPTFPLASTVLSLSQSRLPFSNDLSFLFPSSHRCSHLPLPALDSLLGQRRPVSSSMTLIQHIYLIIAISQASSANSVQKVLLASSAGSEVDSRLFGERQENSQPQNNRVQRTRMQSLEAQRVRCERNIYLKQRSPFLRLSTWALV